MICYQKQKIVDTMTLDLINQFPNTFLVYDSRNQLFEIREYVSDK